MTSRTRFAIPTLVSVLALLSSYAHTADGDAIEPAEKEAAALAPIIVTAQKRSEDVQSVPISISVIGNEQLEQMHATELSDYASYIPGLQMSSTGTPGLASIGIRGITPLGANSTVAMYIDDTPLGSSSFYATAAGDVLDLLPYDVDSFQVLRGPQGTLWGAGALGGVIQYTTSKPDLEQTSVRVGGDVSSMARSGDLGYGARASVNLPLLPGQLAMTASVARQQTPGFVDNVRTGEKDENGYAQTGGRVALRWKANDDLAVSLSAIKYKVDADSNTTVALDPATLGPIYGKDRNDNYVPEASKRELDYFSATVNWDVGFADFVSASSYSHTTVHSLTDVSLQYGLLFPLFGLPSPGLSTFDQKLSLYKTTQEFRLASKPDDRFEWLVGTFYTNENSRKYQILSAQEFDGTPIAGLDPLAITGLPTTYKEYALFGDVTWKFNPNFDITAGLRWARNEQEFTQIVQSPILPSGETPGSSAENVRTWSVSPRWHLDTDTMLYARVATGYQAGGPNLALPDVPPQVGSSTLTSYEAGIKTILADRRLILDAAVYNIDWKKIQVLTTNGTVNYAVNGGKASSKGFEFSAVYTPVSGLRLGLNAAYADASLSEAIPSIGGLDGDRLPFVPKWNASATADYTFDLGNNWSARFGGGLRHTGERTTGVTHDPRSFLLPSYTAFDLNADIANDRWTLRFFIKNLTNKGSYVAMTPLIDPTSPTGAISRVGATPLQPRVIGVGFDAKF